MSYAHLSSSQGYSDSGFSSTTSSDTQYYQMTFTGSVTEGELTGGYFQSMGVQTNISAASNVSGNTWNVTLASAKSSSYIGAGYVVKGSSDSTAPTYSSAPTMAANNSTVDVTFSEAVYDTNSGSGALEAADFVLSISGGSATLSSATPSSIADQGSNVYRLGVSLSGTPTGAETLTIQPAASAIYDAAGNVASNSQSSNHQVSLNDQLAPTFSAISVASNNSTITVTFSEAVYDTNGGSGALEAADFVLSISGGSATLSSATPSSISASGNAYTLGVSLSGTPTGAETLTVQPASSAIYDAAGNVASNSQSSNHQVSLNDQAAPTITSVTSSTSNGTYKTGDSINITVNFSESVTLTGGNGLVVTMADGLSTEVTIAAFSSSTSGSGTYTVPSGATSGDLTVTSIALGSGSALADASSNAIASFAIATNLAASKALVIDGVVPTMSASINSANVVTIAFSEAVYTGTGASGALTLADFSLSLAGGSIASPANAASDFSHSAGDTSATFTLSFSGTKVGGEVLTIAPASSTAIYDAADNAMAASERASVKLHTGTNGGDLSFGQVRLHSDFFAEVAANNAITIKDLGISTAKIAADAVTAAKLADDAVVTANIVDANVTTAKIADNAITLAKMDGLARGKIIYGDASGDPAALALGSAHQFLQSDGTDLAWVSMSGDVTLAAGVATIAADAVHGTMLHTDAADGTTMELSSDSLSVLSVPNALTAGTGLNAAGTFDGAAARTIAIDAAQTAITSVLNASLVIGRDADNDIDFATDNSIIFRAGGEDQLTLVDGALTPSSNAIVDLGTDALEFKDAYFDGTVEADAYTVAGVALAEFIADTAGAMVSGNTETGIAVTYQDLDNTIDFALDAAQTVITSILATDLKIGEDDQTKIDFETADEIHFYAANAEQVYVADGIFGPQANSDVDLGAANVAFKNLYIDGIELGHASANTLTASGGDLSIEGNVVYRAGGTDVPVTDGGTGASSLTDGGILLGSGTSAITAMAVLADGEMIVGDGSGDPVAESGATLRTSIGVGTSDSPQFTNLTLSGNLTVNGTTVTIDSTDILVKDKDIVLGLSGGEVADASLTNANPAVITSSSHGFSDDDYIYMWGHTGSAISDGMYQVKSSDTNTFQVRAVGAGSNVDSSGDSGSNTVSFSKSAVTESTANGSGILVPGTTLHKLTYDSTHGFSSTDDFNIASGKAFSIAGTDVLNGNTLGSGVTASSLTSVGALGGGSIAAGFGAIDNGTSNITTGGKLVIDVDGTAINAAGALTMGAGNDAAIYFDGTDLRIDTASAADISFRAGGTELASLDETGLDLASGDSFKIAGNSVLSASTLGSGVTASSLTSVGTISTGVWNGTAIATAYIADDAVTPAKMNIFDDSLGATDTHIMIADGTDYSSFALSGDVTMTNAGVVTIAAAAVHHSMLHDDIISGQAELAHANIADADDMLISDADDSGIVKRVGVDSLRDHFFGVVSGDATVADGGALTIGADKIHGTMIDGSDFMIKKEFLLDSAHSAQSQDSSSSLWTLTLGSALVGANKKPIDASSFAIYVNGSFPTEASGTNTMASGDAHQYGYYYDASVGTYGTVYLGGAFAAGQRITIHYIGQ